MNAHEKYTAAVVALLVMVVVAILWFTSGATWSMP